MDAIKSHKFCLPDYEAQVHELVGELELQRTQFEEQVRELETDLDVQKKVVAMLKIRLHEEHKARYEVCDVLCAAFNKFLRI